MNKENNDQVRKPTLPSPHLPKAQTEIGVIPPEIWRQYEGKVIVYSENERRVIGVGDTEGEAFDQAEASGVKGLWHVHYAARWGESSV